MFGRPKPLLSELFSPPNIEKPLVFQCFLPQNHWKTLCFLGPEGQNYCFFNGFRLRTLKNNWFFNVFGDFLKKPMVFQLFSDGNLKNIMFFNYFFCFPYRLRRFLKIRKILMQFFIQILCFNNFRTIVFSLIRRNPYFRTENQIKTQ